MLCVFVFFSLSCEYLLMLSSVLGQEAGILRVGWFKRSVRIHSSLSLLSQYMLILFESSRVEHS